MRSSAESIEPGYARVARGAPRCVLVAEEDDLIRERIVRALRDDGYEVLEAEDGFEVVDTVLAPPGRIQRELAAIVADVDLDGYDGLELVARLRRMQMPIPYVLMSHGARDRAWRDGERLGADAVVSSPWDVDEVRNAVDAVVLED